MSVVLDSSVTLARIFPDEWTPEILGVFSDAAVFSAWVPGLWKIELANVLSLSVRKGRMTQQRRDEVLFDLNFLDIVVDLETSDKAWGNTLQLADKYKLTVYDATYLELALRRSLPLATLDQELRAAATAEGIPLLGL